MGKQYESTKSEVSKVSEKSEQIANDKRKLQDEISLLSAIDALLQEADGETIGAVHAVSGALDSKSAQIANEYQENEAEKTGLSCEIKAQLEKLYSGLEIINQAAKGELAQMSLEEAKSKYNQQIIKYKALLIELGENPSDPPSIDSIDIEAKNFTEIKYTPDDYYSVQGVTQSQINQLRGTRGHQGRFAITWKDIQNDYARVGITITDKKAEEVAMSLQFYSGSDYRDMRDACMKNRNGDKLTGFESELLEQYNLCEEYTRIAPVFRDPSVHEIFRGVHKNPSQSEYFNSLLLLNVGDSFNLDRMPSSFTTNFQVSGYYAGFHGIIIHIPVNKLTNAPSIRGISLHSQEDEVLVADYNWQVKAISDQRTTGDGFYHIMLDINNS